MLTSHQKYRELLSSSRTSAIRIAHQAERPSHRVPLLAVPPLITVFCVGFDLVIVRVAADDRIDIDRKTKLIDHYIEVCPEFRPAVVPSNDNEADVVI
jgi:hypothetical protein